MAEAVLVQCAWAAARTKDSYFQAQFLRLKARCGAKKAIVAVAASILTTTYHMLADGTRIRISAPTISSRTEGAQINARAAWPTSGMLPTRPVPQSSIRISCTLSEIRPAA